MLGEGEQYLGAQPMSVKGPKALTVLLDDLDADSALANHVRRHGSIDELAVDDEVVPTGFLVAVTNERVLVFGRSFTGRPKELAAEYPLDEVELDVVDRGERARARTFVFSRADGTVFAGDVGISGEAGVAADRFVESFAEAKTKGA